MGVHRIGEKELDLKKVGQLLYSFDQLELSDPAKNRIETCRHYLDQILEAPSKPTFYGINTGFGALCNTKIEEDKLEEVQYNLLRSHASGTGGLVPKEIVKLMMLFKIQSLAMGHSGVQMSTVERLIKFYNQGVIPEVFQQGSLGASGDLAPLAHMCLPLIGEGYVYLDNKRITAKALHDKLGIEPVKLKSKEGLALINGTQFMSAYGIYILLKAYHLSDWADLISAFSLEAFNARVEPFNELTHKIRPHIGQIVTAHHLRHLLKDGNLRLRKKNHVQDPYSFRCIPQVHGASKFFIDQAAGIFLTEINSVTDNPNIFPMEGSILSGGNFHGQILSMALDQLAIALAELGSISERRVFKLVSGHRGLPAFLTKEPGLQSGLMISQYTAAGIVSQNKQYCTPASVDTIDSSNGQEDHVSMGANAATKCNKVLENLETLLGIELLNAMQALDFREDIQLSDKMSKIKNEYREIVKFIEKDKMLSEEIVKSMEFIKMNRYEIAPPMPRDTRQNPKMN